MKKKPTDEEILKAFSEWVSAVPRGYEFTSCVCLVLGLINRLQTENDELKKTKVTHIHIDKQLKKEYEYELQQAVKDTVKEIADWLDNKKGYCGLGDLLKIRYGVEVE